MFVSHIFPNVREPTRGVFNAQQVTALAQLCGTTVIAPCGSGLPPEERDGVTVLHPPLWRVPLLSRSINGLLYALAIRHALRTCAFDVALANWAYPDAYGVMLLARRYGFPFATTVMGSDVNVYFDNPIRRRQVLQALRSSSAVFARSDALRRRLAVEGIEAITVYNGVDRVRFRPCNRTAACQQLGLAAARRRILYVGNLVPVKGPRVLTAAFAQLKHAEDVDLVFVGSGPEGRQLLKDPRIHVIGSQPHTALGLWFNAADIVCLPSLSEGLPNVILEALACGRPVVASNVGGVPEVVRPNLGNGLLVAPGDVGALANALSLALKTKWDCSMISHSVDAFDWSANARTIARVLGPIAGS